MTAFGADSDSDAIAQTTFYRYRFSYQGTAPLTDAYVGLFVDSDLGNATDDYVGSDTTLDMGFTYNADDFDESSDGYGAAPPALGTVVLQGLDEMHPDREMSVFLSYFSTVTPNGNPRRGTTDWYNYLRGVWQDNKPMLDCGDSYDPSGLACAAAAKPTKYMWPGDPVTGTFWSERNFDGAGHINPSNDRRFLDVHGPVHDAARRNERRGLRHRLRARRRSPRFHHRTAQSSGHRARGVGVWLRERAAAHRAERARRARFARRWRDRSALAPAIPVGDGRTRPRLRPRTPPGRRRGPARHRAELLRSNGRDARPRFARQHRAGDGGDVARARAQRQRSRAVERGARLHAFGPAARRV